MAGRRNIFFSWGGWGRFGEILIFCALCKSISADDTNGPTLRKKITEKFKKKIEKITEKPKRMSEIH